MIILGIDQSLTNFAYVILNNRDVSEFGVFKSKKKGVERLNEIRTVFLSLIYKHKPDLIRIEGYAYGRIFRAHDMGELAGMLKLTAYTKNIKLESVAPTKLKKATTGKGNASKEQMIEHVKKNWGFETKNDNIADAFAIAMFTNKN